MEFKNEKRAIPPAQCGRTASSLALPQRAQDSSLNVSVNHMINQSRFSMQKTGHGVFPSRALRGEGEHVRYLVNSNANIVSAADKRGPATGGRRTSAALVARDRHSRLNSSLFPDCLQNSSLYSFWLPHCAKESVFFFSSSSLLPCFCSLFFLPGSSRSPGRSLGSCLKCWLFFGFFFGTLVSPSTSPSPDFFFCKMNTKRNVKEGGGKKEKVLRFLRLE